jgi:hypothetical protein
MKMPSYVIYNYTVDAEEGGVGGGYFVLWLLGMYVPSNIFMAMKEACWKNQ